jgi:hypothetical protein
LSSTIPPAEPSKAREDAAIRAALVRTAKEHRAAGLEPSEGLWLTPDAHARARRRARWRLVLAHLELLALWAAIGLAGLLLATLAVLLA